MASGLLLLRQLPRWRAIAGTPPRRGEVAVSYGAEQLPGEDAVVIGGHVKFQLLAETFPNAPRDFNVLYLGSSSMRVDAPKLVRLAKRRGAPLVWNQNGVAYRGWYGDGWELVNRPRAKLLQVADYVFFQSAFCKLAADTFYGERRGPWEVLPNPVDTERFVPSTERPRRPLTLLLAGSQYQRYRVETALETIAIVRRERPDARLLVAGALTFAADGESLVRERVERLGLEDAVELTGPYSRADAPALMRLGDILLHPKYNDPCPTAVLEALASGLPVAYSASGGVPELVGEDAGIGIPAPLDWEEDHPPEPAQLADAIERLTETIDERSAAARDRSRVFDVSPWTERHRAVFAQLLADRDRA